MVELIVGREQTMIRFDYNPQTVALIKRTGARWWKEQKSWMIANSEVDRVIAALDEERQIWEMGRYGRAASVNDSNFKAGVPALSQI